MDEDRGRGDITANGRYGRLEVGTSGLGGLLEQLDEDIGSRVDVFETTDDNSGNGIGGILSLKEALGLDEGGV